MILALDIGTTNFKAGIFLNGKLIKVCQRPLEVIDGYKTNGETWFTAFKSVVKELKESLDLSSLRSIILDGNGPTLVSVPSGEALLWLDRRATKESDLLSKKLGFFVDSSFLIPKILRQKRLYPELYKKTKFYFGSADYLAWKLTGEAKIVMALEGLEKWYWNDELLNSLEIDKSKLPPFIKMGEKIGLLNKELAKELGIKMVPVLSGPPDFVTSILGSGSVERGMVCDRSGTSEGINLCTNVKNPNQKLMCYRHPNGEDWNISGIISTSGKSIEFVKGLLGMEKLPFQDFYEFVSKSQPGSGGVIFHPYLAGERAPIWDPEATGSFTGLTLNTEKQEIARSVCEGVCYSIKDVIKTMDYPVKEIRVTGGPSESDFLNQLKADVLQLPVVTTECSDPDLMGLAVLCYTALGDFENVKKCCNALVKVKKVFLPDKSKNLLYEEGYNKFKKIYQALKRAR